ncbi:MAG: CpXC domain-containing protein [Clostridia bacterium]|nr:CpXC domain-containing protein [Clostridia bacterium]MBQ7751790.1 CpXC domain-containing protein [Clostridia bacterium]
MSISIKETIKCPSCHEKSEITVWQSITASDSPDLKSDLLKGKINMFTCGVCGQKALFPSPLLYCDDEKKLVLSFSPQEDSAKRQQLFDEIKKSSKKSGELENYPNYNLRFVTSYNELLEKILIFDSGFNDKVIEVIKLLVLMQDSEKMAQRVCMFGKSDGAEIEFLVQDRRENQIYTSRVPISTYETIKIQLKDSGVKFKSFDWEMVDQNFAASLLRGVNNTL